MKLKLVILVCMCVCVCMCAGKISVFEVCMWRKPRKGNMGNEITFLKIAKGERWMFELGISNSV